MPTKTKSQVVRLHFEDDRLVFIEDGAEDRFCLTMGQAIQACKAYEKNAQVRFSLQYPKMLSRLKHWISEHSNEIEKAFITVQDTGILFLVVTKTKKYDDDFEDKLTDLDLEIARSDDFSVININVQSLPNCGEANYLAFCDPDYTLEF